jgi:hypothetical protein
MEKQGFKVELSEGEEIEIARADKNKERAYFKVKNEVYSLKIKYPFDFKKLKQKGLPKNLTDKTKIIFLKTKLYSRVEIEGRDGCSNCSLENICNHFNCGFKIGFAEYTPLKKLKGERF